MSRSRKKVDTFASRLLRLREAAGLTSAEVARRAGLSPQLVHKIESGKQPDPRLSAVRGLCKALGVSLSEFDALPS